MEFKFEACIIGLGRVGLPLYLYCKNKGLEVCGIDCDKNLLQQILLKQMPFREKGCQEILENLDNITVSNSYELVAESEHIIITVGTPADKNGINLHHLKSVIKSIAPYIRDGHNIMLRSTVPANTTQTMTVYLEKLVREIEENKDKKMNVNMTFCPERIVEGNALEELYELPQIVGGTDTHSAQKSYKFWDKLTLHAPIFTDRKTAELTKILLNVYRYGIFGIANYIEAVASHNNCSYNEILKIANHEYHRGINVTSGMTGGTCLTKDWQMIPKTMQIGNLMQSVHDINQNYYISKLTLLLKSLQNNMFLKPSENITISVLGYTFKRDTDDIRDTVVYTLVNSLERMGVLNIKISDYHISKDDMPKEHRDYFCNEEDVFDTDALIVAMNHSRYDNIKEWELLNKSYNIIYYNMWDYKTGKVKGIDEEF